MIQELQYIADIPSYIFGEESTVGGGEQIVAYTLQEEGRQVWFMVAAAVILLIYLSWVNHWSARNRNHSTLFSAFLYLRSDYVEKFKEMAPSFGAYTRIGSLLGYVALWGAIEALIPDPYSQSIEVACFVIGAILVVNLFQDLLVYMMGVVAGNREFSKILQRVKSISYTIVGILVIPTVLCFSLTNGKAQELFMYVVAAQVVSISAIYLFKTFILFRVKKVSLLHTILYLCTVEIFPMTLIWGFFNR